MDFENIWEWGWDSFFSKLGIGIPLPTPGCELFGIETGIPWDWDPSVDHWSHQSKSLTDFLIPEIHSLITKPHIFS